MASPSILFVQTLPPHGRCNGREGLDALLMGSAFTETALLFVAEGPLQLVKGQAPAALGSRDYAKGFAALAGYGVSEVYCSQSALDDHGLAADDLLIPVQPVGAQDIRALFKRYDRIVTF